ncbi:hypothetical protein N658DRAFT_525060 [Parathielavia hyrcaniae]|uniref:Uncharacterized protein n=1 Tax=Parathielavia hyrcaniae TaxID=113614 RepID=A0AAN6PY22_9PEZI|nr:hypothetical protein N658DRAFT_525060 [Parathielavia hyrcaniae]
MATHRAENQEGLQAATTKSQASSFDPLANTPMKRTEMEDDKKSGQTQEPSPGATNTSQPTATHQPQSEPSKPDESDGNIRVSLPPPSMSPGTGQQAGPSSPMTASVQHHPVFVMRDPDGARFAPFMGEDSPNSTESMTEVIIRDQIRRCEAMLGRSLTHNERETITSHYHSMGCDRGAPSETDEPTMTVRSHPHRNEVEDEPKSVDPSRPHAGDGSNTGGNHQPPLLPSPAPAPSPAAGPFHPPTQPSPGPTTTLGKRPWDPEEKDDPDPINTLPGLRGRPLDGLSEADLRQEIERLEGQLRDVARGGFTLLRFERRASEKRLGKLEAELAAVKAEVTELRARFDEAVVNMERGGGGGSRRAERDAAAAAARHRRGGGLFGFKSVMFVVAMIVWLHVGTEAMVHSKRLADGYGGYVNGGFNGLGSVLVFGTWKQFVVFEAAVVFLGVLGCGAVMG